MSELAHLANLAFLAEMEQRLHIIGMQFGLYGLHGSEPQAEAVLDGR